MNNFSTIYKNVDKPICGIVAFLGLISVLMIGSTSISTGFFSRSVIVQIAAYILGAIAIYIMLRFNYTIFLDMQKLLYISSLILLFLVYVPGLGVEQFGARSWISLGFTTIQPSELVKILYILILANYMNKHKDELYNFR